MIGWISSPETDYDGDGCQDDTYEELDDDNDGIPDFTPIGRFLDLCPRGNTNWMSSLETDNDGDGCQDDTDEDSDDDNDGLSDTHRKETMTNRDGISCSVRIDCDGDGVNDTLDDFPIDSTETTDTDGDGMGNNKDPDIDGDGTDNNIDSDIDGDGIDNETETESLINQYGESCSILHDCDKDGLNDSESSEQLKNYNNISCSILTDCDMDGISDSDDSCLTNQFVWTSNKDTDIDFDGCKDKDNPTTLDINEEEDLDDDNDKIEDTEDVDDDNDGLIEIGNGVIENVSGLLMLHNMRHDLDGTHYNDGTNSSNAGCPSARSCNGYELVTDLDFDADGDGSSFSGDCNVIIYGDNPATSDITETAYPRTDFSGCTIDEGDTDDTYFPSPRGWLPIGNTQARSFNANFEGNGHVIKNLYINANIRFVGLFGFVNFRNRVSSTIRNIGLVGGLVHSSSSSSITSIAGALVAWMSSDSSISFSYATVNVSSSGNSGGLVGFNSFSSIVSSYATGDVASSSAAQREISPKPSVGGLVGLNAGMITSSYAMGNISASSTASDGHATSFAGGLVGYNSRGEIIASYWNLEALQSVNGITQKSKFDIGTNFKCCK